jgi:hypothetical protein
MLKLAQDPTVKWPVEVFVPRDGGKKVKHTFTAEWKLPSQAEAHAVLLSGAVGDDPLRDHLVGWSEVKEADESDLPYSEQAKTKLLDIPYVRAGLVRSFFNAVSGGADKT